MAALERRRTRCAYGPGRHRPGDPSFDPSYEELDRLEAVLFIHPTSPPAGEKVALGQPRPMLQFMFDTTGPTAQDQLRQLWFATAGTPLPIQNPALLATVPMDHIVYGSEYCFTPPSAVATQMAPIDAADTSATRWGAILATNAAQFLLGVETSTRSS